MRFDLKTKLLITAALGGFATPAFADDDACKAVIYGSAWSNYSMQDLAEYASENAVSQDGATFTCGNWYVDGWVSVDLEASGDFGERGFGDEFDATFGNAGQLETFIGTID